MYQLQWILKQKKVQINADKVAENICKDILQNCQIQRWKIKGREEPKERETLKKGRERW
jgi:hypothetical protein